MRNARRAGPLDFDTKYNFTEHYERHYGALNRDQLLREQLRRQRARENESIKEVRLIWFYLFLSFYYTV